MALAWLSLTGGPRVPLGVSGTQVVLTGGDLLHTTVTAWDSETDGNVVDTATFYPTQLTGGGSITFLASLEEDELTITPLVVVVPQVFVPPVVPTRWSALGVTDPLFKRLHHPATRSLIQTGGLWRMVEEATDEEIVAAETVFLGGRQHPATAEQVASLTDAGYGEYILWSGFGLGDYSDGPYGAPNGGA